MTLNALTPQPADKILELMGLFRADPRPDKLDLGVGVYRNAEGKTPVMRAVKAAERRLVEEQVTKSYTSLVGDPAFGAALSDLVLGDVAHDRRALAATPGGTGAVHQGALLVRMAKPEATVWLSRPTWPNHGAILNHLGMKTRDYRYFDPGSGGVDFDGMMQDLQAVQAGDAVVLHGCCHNPTGANLTLPEWHAVADHLGARGVIAFVDLAYQGFGEGLAPDAAGVRCLADRVPEVLIAVSCSKNFGLYRERTGLLIALGGKREVTQGALATLNRLTYSFPPDHGARVVEMILTDQSLRADWEAELEAMRSGMQDLRDQLAAELRARTGSDRFGYLAAHKGMFSLLSASEAQVEAMRRDLGVYVVRDGRMNIAGLNAASVPRLAEAILAVGV